LASRIDLHTHTHVSDGTLSPGELAAKASELGVQVLAITDHDSTAGYQAAASPGGLSANLRFVPGIEISAEGSWPCHLLGYFVNVEDVSFQKALAQFRAWRRNRVTLMVEKLSTLGYPVPLERVLALPVGGSVGRPHIADVLKEKGYVRTRQEAFDRFLKRDGPAFVPGEAPTARDCIELIRHAGGIPVLAHPSYYTSSDLLQRLVEWGLLGLEVYYPDHSRALIRRYLELAETYRLVATGGSDFHGPRTGRTRLASVEVPAAALRNLEEARARL
jgi:predicted metal-dependent phosphoesterase TrpH